MKFTFLKGMLAALSILVILAFQNCSKMSVRDVAADQSELVLSNSIGGEDEVNGPIHIPDVPPTDDLDSDDVADNDCNSDDDIDEREAIAICQNPQKHNVFGGSHLINLKGNSLIVSDEIIEIRGGSGNLAVRGETGRGKMLSLSERGGRIVICDMDVDQISNTNGNLVLVDSQVGVIVGHRGVVKKIRSNIANLIDVKNVK